MTVITAWFFYGLAILTTRAEAPFLIASLAMWALWATFAFWLITCVDRRAWVPAGIRVAVFAWSAIMIQLSALAVGFTGPIIGKTFGRFGIAINAPVFEEATKLVGVILIAAITPRLMLRPVGAVLCGLLSGPGFAFAENWRFSIGLLEEELGGADAMTKLSELATWVLQRGFIDAPWGHMTYSALASVGVYYAVAHATRHPLLRIVDAGACFAAAVILHGLSNASVSLDGSAQLAAFAVTALIELATLAYLILWAMRSGGDTKQGAKLPDCGSSG
jgi:RsiW-degrading membrane proteinase PrsW (M82 family)